MKLFRIILVLTSLLLITNCAPSSKKVDINTDISNAHLERQNYEENTSKEKQPILPFSNKREVRNTDNNFKLPLINFLEILKNSRLSNNRIIFIQNR